MNVANLENCRELYELSGWEDCHFRWFVELGGKREPVVMENDRGFVRPSMRQHGESYHRTPAYDLGYLLRKLPHMIRWEDGKAYLYLEALDGPATMSGDGWNVGYVSGSRYVIKLEDEHPLEDAACKLAIELFKQKILK